MYIQAVPTIGRLLVELTNEDNLADNLNDIMKEVSTDLSERTKKVVISNTRPFMIRSRTGRLVSSIAPGPTFGGNKSTQVFNGSIQAGNVAVRYATIHELGGTVVRKYKPKTQQDMESYKLGRYKTKTYTISIPARPYLFPVSASYSVKYIAFYIEMMLHNMSYGGKAIMKGGVFEHNDIFGWRYV